MKSAINITWAATYVRRELAGRLGRDATDEEVVRALRGMIDIAVTGDGPTESSYKAWLDGFTPTRPPKE